MSANIPLDDRIGDAANRLHGIRLAILGSRHSVTNLDLNEPEDGDMCALLKLVDALRMELMELAEEAQQLDERIATAVC